MANTTLKSQWLDFRKKMLTDDVPNNVVNVVRDAFYAGNMQMFWALKLLRRRILTPRSASEPCKQRLALSLPIRP